MPTAQDLLRRFETESAMLLTPSGLPEPEPTPQDDFLAKPILDYGKSILGETPVDLFTAGARGAWGALQDSYGFLDTISGDNLPDWINNPLGDSVTTGGKIIEGISNFAAGFIPIAGWLGKLGKLGKGTKFLNNRYARDLIAGGVTDFLVWDGHEERLSDLIESVPALQNPVTEFLSVDEDDSEIVGRIKNVLEGGALGFMVDGVLASLKGFKAGQRVLQEGGSHAEAVRVAEETAQAGGVLDSFVAPGGVGAEGGRGRVVSKLDATLDDIVQGSKVGPQGTDANLNPRNLTPEERVEYLIRRGDLNLRMANGDAGSFFRAVERNLDLPDTVPDAKTIADTELDLVDFAAPQDIELFRAQIKARFGGVEGQGQEYFKRLRAVRITADSYAKSIADNYLSRIDDLNDAELAEAVVKLEELAELMAYAKGATAEAGRGFRSLGLDYGRFGARKAALGKTDDVVKETVKEGVEAGTESGAKGGPGRAPGEAAGETVEEGVEEATEAAGKKTKKKKKRDPSTRDIPQNPLDEVIENINRSKGGAAKIKKELHVLRQLYEANGPKALTRASVMKRGDALRSLIETTWMANLISHPKTLTLALLGGLNTVFIRPAELLIGGGLTKITTGDSKALRMAMAHIGTLLNPETYLSSMKLMGQAFKEGRVILDDFGTVDFRAGSARSINKHTVAKALGKDSLSSLGEVLATAAGHVIEWPFGVMSSFDQFVKSVSYRANLHAHHTAAAIDDIRAGILKSEDLPARVTAKVEEATMRRQYFSEATLYRDILDRFEKQGVPVEDRRVLAEAEMEKLLEDPNVRRDISISRESIGNARTDTFTNPLTDNSRIEIAGQILDSAVRKLPLLRPFLTFIRTPTNILKFTYERTLEPLHAVLSVAKRRAFKDRFGPKLSESGSRLVRDMVSGDRVRQSEAMGRMGFGFGVMATAYGLMSADRITGKGPEDLNMKRVWQEAGYLPYSIKIGDTWYSYQRLDPIASMLGLIADLGEYSKWVDEDHATTVGDFGVALVFAIAENFNNKSYLTGITNLAGLASDPDSLGKRAIKSYAGTLVPNYFKAGADLGADHFQEIRTALDAMQAKIPVFNTELPPLRNILGEKVKRIRSAFSEETMKATDVFLPIYAQSVSDDEIFQELVKIQAGFGLPQDVQYNIDLRKFKNASGQDAYDRWMELTGEVRIGGLTLRQRLLRTIKSPSYQRLPDTSTPFFDTPRKNQLRSVINRYRDRANKAMRREYPELDSALRIVERGKRNAGRGGTFDGTALEDFAPEFF